MTKYLVFRHGLNAFNQPYSQQQGVAIVEAKNGKEACEKAIKENGVTVYNNQHLTYLCESKVMRKQEYIDEWNYVSELRALIALVP